MKALTGLPTQAYVQVSEEAKVPLSDLLRLVQELETGATPAYLARHRPDVSSGLDDAAIRRVRNRLREQLDLAERRIVVLTAIARQERLTDELREQIEQTFNRRALEDIYLPYKPKRRSAADEAIEQSLEPLARFLWAQDPVDADPSAEAAKYIRADATPATPEAALEGACEIIARWLGENTEIRRDVREIARELAVVRARATERVKRSGGKDEAYRKRCAALDGMSAPVWKIPWRQGLAMRRGAHDGYLELSFDLPEERILGYLRDRLVKQKESPFAVYLETAARKAYQDRLADALGNEVRHRFEEGCDNQAIVVYERNLRRLLTAPPAGAVVALGIEAARPGGWRAAVVDAAGRFVEGGILGADPKREGRTAKTAQAPETQEKPAAEASIEAVSEAAPLQVPEQTSETPEAAAPAVAAKPETAETEAVAPDTASNEQASESSTAAPETPEPAPSEQAAEMRTAVPPEAAQTEAGADSTPPTEEAAKPASETAAAEEAPAGPANHAAAPDSAAPETAASEAADQGAGAKSSGPAAEKPVEAAADTPPNSGGPKRPPEPDPTPNVDLADLVARHNVRLIVAGNGPGVRGVERFIRSAWRGNSAPMPAWTSVPDAGTWIYATSKAARKELPRLEPALRSAVCLARRAQDPLHEMVKMDPRVLGIGQGHHDVDQRRLREALGEAVESCVAQIGLDVNRASVEALALAPGMTQRSAKRIVEQRERAGPYTSRNQLSRTPGINRRVWDQAGGFLRVYGGENPLDETGIHPNHYKAVEALLSAAGVSACEALDQPDKMAAVDLHKCLEEINDKNCSEALLRSLIAELRPENRNPRRAFKPAKPTFDVAPLADLKVGIKVEGVITNVTAFGAFVDIGAEHDGLAHISRLTSEQVADGRAKLKAGDRMTVYVTAVEEGGNRISLSSREPRETPESARRRRVSPEARRDADRRGPRRSNGARPGSDKSRAPMRRTFGPDSAQQAREQEQLKKMSLDEKLDLLGDKFRTKV